MSGGGTVRRPAARAIAGSSTWNTQRSAFVARATAEVPSVVAEHTTPTAGPSVSTRSIAGAALRTDAEAVDQHEHRGCPATVQRPLVDGLREPPHQPIQPLGLAHPDHAAASREVGEGVERGFPASVDDVQLRLRDHGADTRRRSSWPSSWCPNRGHRRATGCRSCGPIAGVVGLALLGRPPARDLRRHGEPGGRQAVVWNTQRSAFVASGDRRGSVGRRAAHHTDGRTLGEHPIDRRRSVAHRAETVDHHEHRGCPATVQRPLVDGLREPPQQPVQALGLAHPDHPAAGREVGERIECGLPASVDDVQLRLRRHGADTRRRSSRPSSSCPNRAHRRATGCRSYGPIAGVVGLALLGRPPGRGREGPGSRHG